MHINSDDEDDENSATPRNILLDILLAILPTWRNCFIDDGRTHDIRWIAIGIKMRTKVVHYSSGHKT